eukprot:gene3449-biopygen15777
MSTGNRRHWNRQQQGSLSNCCSACTASGEPGLVPFSGPGRGGVRIRTYLMKPYPEGGPRQALRENAKGVSCGVGGLPQALE